MTIPISSPVGSNTATKKWQRIEAVFSRLHIYLTQPTIGFIRSASLADNSGHYDIGHSCVFMLGRYFTSREQKYSWRHVPETFSVGFFLVEKAC
jgi:hypothetical protein